jgi:hypothetical protein
MSDITGIVADACERAIEELDMKMEIDGYTGPGRRSYEDDDIASMKQTQADFANMGVKIAQGHKIVILSPDAYATVCGLVQPSEGAGILEGGTAVYSQGIFGPWDELREVFPAETFLKWAQENGDGSGESGNGYDPHFGE